MNKCLALGLLELTFLFGPHERLVQIFERLIRISERLIRISGAPGNGVDAAAGVPQSHVMTDDCLTMNLW